MYICNNATITFDGLIPDEVSKQLNENFSEVGTFNIDNHPGRAARTDRRAGKSVEKIKGDV